MPRYPEFADRTQAIGGSVFERFRGAMASRGDDIVKLHIGDSYAPPPYNLPVDAVFRNSNRDFNRYCDTFGIAPLREALAEKVSTDNALSVGPENILVTAGATNALSAAVQALLDPQDEVIVLSPSWPFYCGMIRLANARAVEVSCYADLFTDESLDLNLRLQAALSERTAMLYVNSPNNPSGKVLNREQLEVVARFARDNNLWMISDEAYDGMTFDSHEHVTPATLADMADRTVSIFTFSKVYMFAGLRLGYAVGNRELISTLNKTMVHQLYSPSTLAQQMMVDPVRRRASWSPQYVAHVQEVRDDAFGRLALSIPKPQGAYYFFFDASEYLHGRSGAQLIEDLIAGGVSVAPGADFGAGFENFIRVCFAGENPERVRKGMDRLRAGLLKG